MGLPWGWRESADTKAGGGESWDQGGGRSHQTVTSEEVLRHLLPQCCWGNRGTEREGGFLKPWVWGAVSTWLCLHWKQEIGEG